MDTDLDLNDVVAPPTLASAPGEGHYGRVSLSVFNLRLTEKQFAELRFLRDQTGITIQAHIRRAILDYLHQLKLERPELWGD